jgi:RNA polymerase sigma factor (TIGR02999 family)
MADVTQILQRIESGDPSAAEQLLPLIYDELRKLAAQKLRHEKPGQTLQATALVHESYLRLMDGAESQPWRGRGHFFAAAAEAMRRILVESARRKKQIGRGGNLHRIPLDMVQVAADSPAYDILALDEALRRLDEQDTISANLVKLRYFGGMTMAEAADAVGMPLRSAERNWRYARAWLHRELS